MMDQDNDNQDNDNQDKKKDCITFLCFCINSVLCIIMVITFLNIVDINFEKEEYNVTKINYPNTDNSTLWSFCDNEYSYQFKYCIDLYVYKDGIQNKVIKSYNTKQKCTIKSDCKLKSKDVLEKEINHILDKYLYKKHNFYDYEDEIYLEYYNKNYTIPIVLFFIAILITCIYCIYINLCL